MSTVYAFTPAQKVEHDRVNNLVNELSYAIKNTESGELYGLAGHFLKDGGKAMITRAGNLLSLFGAVIKGAYHETKELISVVNQNGDAVNHLSGRIGAACGAIAETGGGLVNSLESLINQVKTNPEEAWPKIFALALSSLIVSGGVDGNGGAPDMDIVVLGIGDHRSPFTHSILLGSALEATIRTLIRLVQIAHKNLPAKHDPFWDKALTHSTNILNATGQGASIGLAYHFLVDGVFQPGAYHGLPFDLSIEVHQAFQVVNAVAEGSAAFTNNQQENTREKLERINLWFNQALNYQFHIWKITCLCSPAEAIVAKRAFFAMSATYHLIELHLRETEYRGLFSPLRITYLSKPDQTKRSIRAAADIVDVIEKPSKTVAKLLPAIPASLSAPEKYPAIVPPPHPKRQTNKRVFKSFKEASAHAKEMAIISKASFRIVKSPDGWSVEK